MLKESRCLKVPKYLGEETLSLANMLGLTDKSLQIQKEKTGFLSIPLSREPNEKERSILKVHLLNFEIETCIFANKKQPEKTLAQNLAEELPSQLLAYLPRALDVVGDIAIIEMPIELEDHKNAVGEAILRSHRNVRVVLSKVGAVRGTFRLRDFEFIAGEHRTATLYKEYGCSYQVDVAKAYFSPRLSYEHQRVAALVKQCETVVDLFAGVGPFAVLIAKTRPGVKVYAIDINPDAVDLLKKNARLNRVENRVFPITGDARSVINEKLRGSADRVIMNLPETAIDFIDVACKAVKPSGGMVHFYGFIKSLETLEDLERRFSESVEKMGRKVVSFQHAKTVRNTAPYEYQAVLDTEIF